MKAKKIQGPIVAESVSIDDVKNHKIYSVNSNAAPAGGNRQKNITVTGIPGSAFTLVVQDENNAVYSFLHGAFGANPSPLIGVIPPGGVFRKTISTGRAKKVELRLQSGDPDPITSVVSQSIQPKTVTITAIGTGLSDFNFSGPVTFTSTPTNEGGSTIFNFEFVIKAINNKIINYVRAIKYDEGYSLEREFELYDGVVFAENPNAHTANLSGKAINSDFKLIEAEGYETTQYKIKNYYATAPNGFGEIPDASEGHSTWVSDSVRIQGSVEVGAMGNENLTINLMLYNFLEIL